jgi:3-deoxy-7-phosphoheptulonate synthase
MTQHADEEPEPDRGVQQVMSIDRPTRAGRIRDQRIASTDPLSTPHEVMAEIPLDDVHAEVLLRGRADVCGVLDGRDDRLLVVVGPCSVHDVEATHEYAERLSQEAGEYDDDLCIAMRVYFEKPRTTIGWKGLINDPYLDGSGDVNTGLRMARRLLVQVLGLGLPVGCEFLDPITPQYISDTVCWGAIGARTTESQVHRQLGSGLSMPVGFKNRTDGNVQVAVDAVRAAGVPHSFAGIDDLGRAAILHTTGNGDCHVILRGGRGAPNYDAGSVAQACARLGSAGLPERVMIDLSHDNSDKRPELQPQVARVVGEQLAAGDQRIVGVMLESFLVEGRQDLGSDTPLVYGQSITDGCVGWETTIEVLDGLAEAVRARRAARR